MHIKELLEQDVEIPPDDLSEIENEIRWILVHEENPQGAKAHYNLFCEDCSMDDKLRRWGRFDSKERNAMVPERRRK